MHVARLIFVCSFTIVMACQSDTVSKDTAWTLGDEADSAGLDLSIMDMNAVAPSLDLGTISPPDIGDFKPDTGVQDLGFAEPDMSEPVMAQSCRGSLPQSMDLTPQDGDVVRASLYVDTRTGCPHISYYLEGEVRYTRWDGTSWRDEGVPFEHVSYENAIWVESNGEVKIVVERDDEPGLFLLTRSLIGRWSTEKIFNEAWIWEINHVTTPDGDHVLLIETASRASSGSNPAYRILQKQADGRWQASLVLEDHISFGITVDFDEDQALFVTTLNEGGKINDPEKPSNLIIVRSSPDELSQWTTQRIAQGSMIEAWNPHGVRYQDTLHVIAVDQYYEETSGSVMLHGQRDDVLGWRHEPFQNCEPGSCIPITMVNIDGTLFLVFTRLEQVIFARFDGTSWIERPLEEQARHKVHVEPDPFEDIAHIILTPSRAEFSRTLTYIPLDLSSF